MKVLLLNGSPHKAGCTYTALSEVAGVLNAAGVDTEWFWIGTAPQRGCVACRKCRELGRCVFNDDLANPLLEALRAADGVVVGSPVYYAGPNGLLCALLDRVFYSSGNRFDGTVAAAVVSARRAGTTAALDRLYKYFHLARMPIVASQYWAMVHGNTPDEVRRDEEGMQVMRALGGEMARLLKATANMPPAPREQPPARTNFIR